MRVEFNNVGVLPEECNVNKDIESVRKSLMHNGSLNMSCVGREIRTQFRDKGIVKRW